MSKTVPTVPLGGQDPAAADGADGRSAGVRTQPLSPRARERTLSGEEAEAARADDEGDESDAGGRAIDPDRAAELIGRILAGRYEIREVLGRGGMGLVYRGWHLAVDRPVAIKVLRRDLARSTDAVARFHREARAAAKIGSEHIVDVIDYNYTDDGDAYIVMELLEGEDLGKVIRREGPLPEARAASIARQVGRALEMAHAKGIIHRDLKSENVFVLQRDGRDYVKLLDFGISKVSEGDEGRGPMTSEGVVMGTPHYMAPEQAISAAETDHRIDLYALGCLLYEMLTGRVPFTGKNAVEVVFKHVHEPPVPPSRARDGGVTPDLEAVVLKLLAKTREERFATAGAFLAALDAARVSIPGADGAALSSTGPQRAEALAAGAAAGPSGRPTPAKGAQGASSSAARTVGARGPGTRMVAAALGVAGISAAAFVAMRSAGPARDAGHDAGMIAVHATTDAGITPGAAVFDAGALSVVPEGTPPGHGPIAGAADGAASEAIDASALATAPRDTWWTIEVQPRTAHIELDGVAHPTNRLREQVARGVEHRLVLGAPGYASQAHAIRIERAQTSRFALARLPAGGLATDPEHPDAAPTVVVVVAPPDAEPSGGNPGGGEADGGDLDLLHDNPYGAGQTTPR